MKASKIRKEARENLKGKWGKAVCITLAFIAISFVIGYIQGLVEEYNIIYDLIDLAFFIINIPLSFGLLISFIKLKRGENVSAFDFLNDGFNHFKKAWGICFQTLLKLWLPIICLIIVLLPIIMYIVFWVLYMTALMVGNLSAESYLSTLTASFEPIFTILPISCILLIPAIIYMIRKSLLYVLAYNVSYDNPDLTSKECVKKSAELMNGNRGKYFLLEFSFIGWATLAVLTIGIGILWLAPYMQVAAICFYEKLLKPEAEKIEETVNTKE